MLFKATLRRFLVLCLAVSFAAITGLAVLVRFKHQIKQSSNGHIKQIAATVSTTTATPRPAPAPTTKSMANNPVLVDYKNEDYRGFILVQHEQYGLMMLRCTRKKSKPPHWQLPGGHVDDFEFVQAAAATNNGDRSSQLLHAGQQGAARELFEETGIDIRNQLDRLQPADLHRETKKKDKFLSNEYKHRLFYTVTLTDDDFPQHGVAAMGTEIPGNSLPYKHIKVRRVCLFLDAPWNEWTCGF